MVERNPYTDITAGNHGGNKQSNAANIVVAPYKLSWREKILAFMAERDAQGLGTSCRHAADYFGREAGHIAGRFTELKADGLIESTRDTENNYMVYRLTNSSRVLANKAERRTALVVGAGLAGEIVVEKVTGGWQIVRITKCLEPVVANTPIGDIGKRLTALHLTYTWIKS